MSANKIKNPLTSIISLFSKNSKDQPSDSKKSGSTIKEKGDYYIWKKGEVHALSPYFSTKEFECKCNYPECKEQKISKTLIVRLDLIRKEAKQPVIVTSAFRCHEHQEHLRATGVNTVVAKKSQHEEGNAVDITPSDRKNVRTKFLEIVEKHFDAIGLSNRFLHVDLRNDKKRRWEY